MLEAQAKNQVFGKIDPDCQKISQHFVLTEIAKEILKISSDSASFVTALIAAELHPDAVHFLAHGLPKREALWWAYLCAAQQVTLEDEGMMIEALALIKEWIYRPQEPIRRQMESFAEKMRFQSAVSWAAIAVFWSGGSITAEGEPQVFPAEYLYAKGVAGAVMLAAASVPAEIQTRYQRFLKQGIHIAEGGSGDI